MNNFISDLRYHHSIVKYAKRFGVTRALDHFNCSRSFIYKLLSKYDGTFVSLKPESKRPKYHPRQTTDEEYTMIKNYHRRNPDIGLVILW